MFKIKNLKDMYQLFSTQENNFQIKIGKDIFPKSITLKNITDLGEIFSYTIFDIESDRSQLKLSLKKSTQILQTGSDRSEKYGVNSTYYQVNKIYEPYFYHTFNVIKSEIPLPKKIDLLDIGINKGDEFELIQSLGIDCNSYTGIDYSTTAIDEAKRRFPDANFINFDLNGIEDLTLPQQYNFFLSIGTLQSAGFNGKEVMRVITKEHLTKDAIIVLGFPNCRYLEDDVKYGAKVKNYREHELSLIIKDIDFYKRYFQQKKKRVRVMGKYYLFLIAW